MSRLNYHHLYYFWQVARQGNLTQTAQRLHISQSALSSQIKQLEQALNVQLFIREGRKLSLTESGYHALSYAEEIFKNGEELEQLLSSGTTLPSAPIRIGILSTISRNFIEQFIQPLINQNDCKFSLQSMSQTGLLNAMSELQLDMALTNIPIRSSTLTSWQSRVLARQPVAIIGPPNLDLTNKFDARYRKQRWVLPYGENPLRSAFDAFAAQYQLQPEIVAESDDMAMLRLLTRDTGALAVMPEVVVKDELDKGELKSYMLLPNVFEIFYAVTAERRVVHPKLGMLLRPLM
ncbi:LysR family transcriptional regulator [Shewanella avicenniae]|uniref:LysR family transcriptional regulator n=1 Tax=Shewanella avicenniae TaxID=2814294 RepID=A0ABX7QT83_9GAMM|nr:LysR family transcriptional regulator [Shewanella avicenniae]QSX33891.1 LysR family transcriptional regulator [Shewanella avicenniae]